MLKICRFPFFCFDVLMSEAILPLPFRMRSQFSKEKDMAQANKVNPIPDGMHSVTPHLVCNGATQAIEFYKKAFSAVEMLRLPAPDGKLMHACIKIGNSLVMLADEMPSCGAHGPLTLKGSPVTLHLATENADALFEQAVKAGASVKMPLADMFWGDRYGVLQDPYGHNWSVATHIRNLTEAEILEASKQVVMA
jgi:uncharacterized glyoxalase superfamily protein PhnB